jgi:aminoglycoside phosphotransferase (APT) family kinase protein
MTTTPAADWSIDQALVKSLLAQQHPDLSGLTPVAQESGWDNALFRLGPDLAVRLPRRVQAVELLAKEVRWLPRLAPGLGLAVPVPRRMGVPGCGYPSPWAVVDWVPGEAADLAPPDPGAGADLGRFLRGLHVPAPDQAPRNPVRGCPLADRESVVAGRLTRLAGRSGWDEGSVRRIWGRALAVGPSSEALWLHGDLHPRNLVVREGRLAGVVDWGDLGAGDPATDLAGFFLLGLSPGEWEGFEAWYGPVGPDTVLRTLGWAVALGLLFWETGLADHPRHAAIGSRALDSAVRFARHRGLV